MLLQAAISIVGDVWTNSVTVQLTLEIFDNSLILSLSIDIIRHSCAVTFTKIQWKHIRVSTMCSFIIRLNMICYKVLYIVILIYRTQIKYIVRML